MGLAHEIKHTKINFLILSICLPMKVGRFQKQIDRGGQNRLWGHQRLQMTRARLKKLFRKKRRAMSRRSQLRGRSRSRSRKMINQLKRRIHHKNRLKLKIQDNKLKSKKQKKTKKWRKKQIRRAQNFEEGQKKQKWKLHQLREPPATPTLEDEALELVQEQKAEEVPQPEAEAQEAAKHQQLRAIRSNKSPHLTPDPTKTHIPRIKIANTAAQAATKTIKPAP
jgi:hypothetical protein